MSSYSVHYRAVRPVRFTRMQLAIRLLAMLAFGAIGVTFGLVFMVAYLLLPAFAAARLVSNPVEFEIADAPRLVRMLHWLSAVFAWAWLVTDELPSREPSETVRLSIDGPTVNEPSRALWRVITGLPSALMLGLLSFFGGLVWLWAALTVLMSERVGSAPHRYLEGLQRWTFRLLAYQASLVEEYPPFTLHESRPWRHEPTTVG